MRTVFLTLAILASVGAASDAAAPPVPAFMHVAVIVFENKEYSSVIGSASAPTFTRLARSYATLTSYDAVAHPSLPNYIAMVSGSTQDITTDCTACQVNASNLVDALEKAGKTWRVYAEGLPYAGFTGPFFGRYAKKHDPFMYFRDIVRNPDRRQHVVPLAALRNDARVGSLPDFAFVIPDLCHSTHDCSVRTGDRWLRSQIPLLVHQPDTAVFVVFDEGASNLGGGGHVPALVAGTAVKAHSRYTATTGHYGLLRTIEDAWGLDHLGRSGAARPITGIWR